MKSLNATTVLLLVLMSVVIVSGCIQETGPRVISASNLLENDEDYYGKPVAVVGTVSELGELFCSCFRLTSGGQSVQVWYDTMTSDDGRQWPAVSVEGISNGDEVIVTGMLQAGGTYSSKNDFWARSITKSSGEPPIGGDRDEHGCLPTAGYTWCESKQKCLRLWEEDCPGSGGSSSEGGGSDSDITDFESCIAAGYPAMESHPRQCMVPGGETFTEVLGGGSGLTIGEAMAIAEASECVENGTLSDSYSYNQVTETWWIDLNIEKPGCSPACVVDEVAMVAEINWRCTGLLE